MVCEITQGYNNLQNIYHDVQYLPKENYIIDEKNKKITDLDGYEYKIKTFSNEELSFSTHFLGDDFNWTISRVDGSFFSTKNSDSKNVKTNITFKGQCIKKQNTLF